MQYLYKDKMNLKTELAKEIKSDIPNKNPFYLVVLSFYKHSNIEKAHSSYSDLSSHPRIIFFPTLLGFGSLSCIWHDRNIAISI